MKKIFNKCINNMTIFILLCITVIVNLYLFHYEISDCYCHCYSSGSCNCGYGTKVFHYTSGFEHNLQRSIFVIIYIILFICAFYQLRKKKSMFTFLNILFIICASCYIMYSDIEYANNPQEKLPSTDAYGTYYSIRKC